MCRTETAEIQVYVRMNDIGEDEYKGIQKWDIGDIVEVKGFVFQNKNRRNFCSCKGKSGFYPNLFFPFLKNSMDCRIRTQDTKSAILI